MNKEQWQLYKDFCEFAKLQDNSDAEVPNCNLSLQLYMNGTGVIDDEIKDWGWDPLDDPSIFSPETLVYVLLMAKEYFKNQKAC